MKAKKIKGFGPKRINSVAKEIQQFKVFLNSLNSDDIKYAIEHNKKRVTGFKENPKIKDKIFVLSGFGTKPNYNLEDYLYDNSGNIINVVTSNVECVIVNNVLDITTKMQKAYDLKIPVYTIEEFQKRYE